MADDSLNWNIGVRDIVVPEFVPRVSTGPVEDRSCRNGRLAFADEQAQQAALGDRAGREVFVPACSCSRSRHRVKTPAIEALASLF
jgi:hypothetical protein